MKVRWIYTKKAEKDGVAKCGEPVKEGFGYSIAYLELHGYCKLASDAAADETESETTGLAGPSAHGAVRRARKPKP